VANCTQCNAVVYATDQKTCPDCGNPVVMQPRGVTPVGALSCSLFLVLLPIGAFGLIGLVLAATSGNTVTVKLLVMTIGGLAFGGLVTKMLFGNGGRRSRPCSGR